MRYIGHNAWPTRPRKGRPTKVATALVEGDRIRVRFFEYGAQKDVNDFATVWAVVGATACSAMQKLQPWRVVFTIACDDDHARRMFADSELLVEVAS